MGREDGKRATFPTPTHATERNAPRSHLIGFCLGRTGYIWFRINVSPKTSLSQLADKGLNFVIKHIRFKLHYEFFPVGITSSIFVSVTGCRHDIHSFASIISLVALDFSAFRINAGIISGT